MYGIHTKLQGGLLYHINASTFLFVWLKRSPRTMVCVCQPIRLIRDGCARTREKNGKSNIAGVKLRECGNYSGAYYSTVHVILHVCCHLGIPNWVPPLVAEPLEYY